MSHSKQFSGYRKITLVGKDPPGEVLRHGEMIPGETGRYAKVVRYRYEATKTLYEVLHFKAGRPPRKEEVLEDLRGDLQQIDQAEQDSAKMGAVSAWIDSALFSGSAKADLEKKRRDIQATIAAVEENFDAGESVEVP